MGKSRDRMASRARRFRWADRDCDQRGERPLPDLGTPPAWYSEPWGGFLQLLLPVGHFNDVPTGGALSLRGASFLGGCVPKWHSYGLPYQFSCNKFLKSVLAGIGSSHDRPGQR